MRYFLIVYHRSRGQLLVDKEFDNSIEAGSARLREERAHMADSNIEVVVLSGASRDIIRRTHSRYFLSIGEIARNAQKLIQNTADEISASIAQPINGGCGKVCG